MQPDFHSRRRHLSQPAHLEQTIAEPLEFMGVGLHSGAPVTMRLLPAPAGSGISFRRTDLDNFEIPATGRNVAKVSYATSLMRQGVLISTTEHLLSALIGMGVDNVIVELDNLELPILDGSALPYVEAFLQRGHPHPAPPARDDPRAARRGSARGRQVHRRLSRLRLQHSYAIDFPAPIGQQKDLRRPGGGDVRHGHCPGAHLWLQGRRAEAARHGADSRRRARRMRSSWAPRGRRTARCALRTNMCATRCWT